MRVAVLVWRVGDSIGEISVHHWLTVGECRVRMATMLTVNGGLTGRSHTIAKGAAELRTFLDVYGWWFECRPTTQRADSKGLSGGVFISAAATQRLSTVDLLFQAEHMYIRANQRTILCDKERRHHRGQAGSDAGPPT